MDLNKSNVLKVFIGLLGILAVGGCSPEISDGWRQSRVIGEPVAGLRLVEETEDHLTFEWSLINHSRLAVWVSAEWQMGGWDPTTQPRLLVTPPSTLLLAYSPIRIAYEDDTMYEPPFWEVSRYQRVDPGAQIFGMVTIPKPYEARLEGDFQSVFRFDGGYGHEDDVFEGTEDERRVVSMLRHVRIAMEYWLVDPVSGLPETQTAYDELYALSVATQAMLAEKSSADSLCWGTTMFRRSVVSPPWDCEIPLVEPVALYFDPPVEVE